jgi:transposase-like protein
MHLKRDLQKCLACEEQSLWFNDKTHLYECLNTTCKKRYTALEYQIAVIHGQDRAAQGTPRKLIELLVCPNCSSTHIFKRRGYHPASPWGCRVCKKPFKQIRKIYVEPPKPRAEIVAEIRARTGQEPIPGTGRQPTLADTSLPHESGGLISCPVCKERDCVEGIASMNRWFCRKCYRLFG